MTATASAARAEGPARFPLTEAQRGMWFAQRIDAANPTFNTGHLVILDGPLDRTVFAQAITQAQREAETLAIRIRPDDGGDDTLEIDPSRLPVLERLDMTGEPAPEAAALALARADMARPLDPTRDPLARQVLAKVGPERHFWYQRIHHLAIDGVGTMTLCDRVADLYGARVSGREPGAPLSPLSAVLQEDDDYRASEKYAKDRAYWADEMTGAEAASLAGTNAAASPRIHRLSRDLDGALPDALMRLSKRAQLPWPDAATALIGAYCARHIAADEVVLGVPHMGRFGTKAARAASMVMNVLPLRLRVDEDAPLADVLNEAAKRMMKGRRHGRYRGEQIARDLRLVGTGRRLTGPLVNILPFDEAPQFAGLSSELVILGTGPVEDLTISLRGDPATGRMRLEIEANPALYDEADIAAHAPRLEDFLIRAADAERLADVATASTAEARWLERLNTTAHPIEETTLTTLIERRLAATPEAVAISFAGETVSYGELDARSAALAAKLGALGAGPEKIVAVALPRSVELIVGLIAILRAGAAYMPVDTTHPAERLRRIFDSAGPVATLALPDAALPATAAILAPDDWPREADTVPAGGADLTPNNPAYVIYTSGSTGEPKGVVVEHRAIVNRLEWMRTHYGFSPADRILQKTPMTFDVSVWEFFLAFLSGATLVVAPPDAHKDPLALAQILRTERITTCHFVPSMLGAFLAEPSAKGLDIARVFCSGEELTADLRDRFHKTIAGELHNLYGPTEAAVDVSYWPASRDDASRPVPIGWPVWNTALHVLDARMRPVPPGVVGDLYLAGRQLARGYLGRPDLTAERFIDDPHRSGDRLYRTGDVARRRHDGAVMFLGRIDHQVKIRGLRIELDEIEAAVTGSGLVRQAGVIATDRDGLGPRILAYVVPGEGYDEERLAAHVAALVPDYMVPAAFVALDALPVTTNGKLDRAALPAPDIAATQGRAAATETEIRVASLFAEILKLKTPPAADGDFFALGGHSLLAVELMRRIREEFGRDPGLGALFANASVERLSAVIEAADERVSGLEPLIRLTEGDGLPVFVIHPAGGISWCYGGLARTLGRPVLALQARALSPDCPAPKSLAAMAEDYGDQILGHAPAGPIHIAGWSVGGILAQAVAASLQRRGARLGVVALLDAYPCDCWRDEPDPGPGAELKALLAIAGHDPDQLVADGLALTRPTVMTFLKESESPLGQLPDEALDGVMRVVATNNRLVRGHHHDRFSGHLTHFRAALDHGTSGLTPASWAPYADGIEIIDVPSLHGYLTGAEATAIIAPELKSRLERAERAETEAQHA
ncbi:enterobactin synthetase component F [Breoghania corrubedonensis]|uniref:Enterobactin synthetase component F n=1 Tax=Breoghania corrubedonensis TaxID=665038 RepID=A0A2T5V6J3_9HYPH|nr:non-ribosomal peptide synthetase [Breoghania corrubedonensis]PTW59378.1 enterobactin synthetase component F [Breoghania corrubedonensis]